MTRAWLGSTLGIGRRSWDLTAADVDKQARSRSLGPWAGQPLSKPPGSAEVLRYRANLAAVRDFTATRARRAGLPPARVTDLVIAVAELAPTHWFIPAGRGR